jgi:hypothetical protein
VVGNADGVGATVGVTAETPTTNGVTGVDVEFTANGVTGVDVEATGALVDVATDDGDVEVRVGDGVEVRVDVGVEVRVEVDVAVGVDVVCEAMKFAVTFRFAIIVTLVEAEVPLASSDQLLNWKPAAGTAVNATTVPEMYTDKLGFFVTDPLPEGLTFTVRVYVMGGP